MREFKLIKSGDRKIERIKQKPEAKLIRRFEFSFQDQQKLKEAQEWLKNIINPETVKQLFSVLLSTQNKSQPNHCNEAVKSLGINLTKHSNSGEKSFFDLAPEGANFTEIRTEENLKNTFTREKYHSAAMIEFPQGKKEELYLIIDLLYGYIDIKKERENILILCYQGKRKAVLSKLNEYYGGKWKIVNFLNKEKKNFKYNIE